MRVVVVLCAEDAVAQACGIDLTVDNGDTTASPPTAATTVPHMISSNAKGADNSAATASSLVKGRRVRLRQAPPGGIMGVMPPKIAAFWKFVDGLSERVVARHSLLVSYSRLFEWKFILFLLNALYQ